MRTSVSLLDALFGKKITFDVPDTRGGRRKLRVTEKRMEQMVAEKRLSEAPDSSIVLFLIGPHGAKTATMRIGEDIDQTKVDEFRDPETGVIYGLYHFLPGGVENTYLVQRCMYEETKK